MPTPPTPPIWTLNASGITPVGSAGQTDLAGCHITENNAGTAYEFTEPNPNNVLSTTTGSSLPSVPFTFPVFTYDSLEWTITVTSLGVGVNGAGTWSTPGDEHNDHADTGPENGDFTAQSGSGLGEEESAAYAKA
jgi:hypothetical protein